MRQPDKYTALSIFAEAVKAVHPSALIPSHLKYDQGNLFIGEQRLPLKNYDGVYILSVGKAASAMAQETEKILGDKITAGLVVTKYQHGMPLQYCQTIEAGHPVPDENSVAAAQAILGFLQSLTTRSLLLCFISGGASALIADIAEGITLQDMQALSRLLLQCGADIHEINTVRKHIAFLKGGQLVRHAGGAYIYSFIISDVLGDDMSVIASGLTVGDPSSFGDAWQVLDKYAIVDKVPDAIKSCLLEGINNGTAKTAILGELLFNKVHNYIIGNNRVAIYAAAQQAAKLGFITLIIDNLVEGEAREAAKKFVGLLKDYNGPKPACLLAGGETTVTISGNGNGGRNQEFVLAALCELNELDIPNEEWPVILSGGTDGTDGPTDAAGAVIDINIINNIIKSGEKPDIFLTNNDSYHFFKPHNALIITGATQTNVIDIVIAIIK